MFERLMRKTTHIIVTLRFSVLSIFVTLFLFAMLMLIGITYARYMYTIKFIALQLMNKVSETTHNALSHTFTTVDNIEQLSLRLIVKGTLDPNNEQQMINYTYYILKYLRNVQGVMWGDEAGNFIISYRKFDGTTQSMIIHRRPLPAHNLTLVYDADGHIIQRILSKDFSYDPRLRPWYQEAKSKKKQTWVGTYVYKFGNLLGISIAAPVYKANGALQGIFGIDIELDFLSHFISKDRITANQISYIIKDNGKVVALPQLIKLERTATTKVNLIDINSLSLPWVAKSFALYQQTKQQNFSFIYQHKNYLASYKPISDLAFHGWLVGVVIPEEDFVSNLQRTGFLSLVLMLGILLGSIFIVSILISRVVKPLKTLVQETEKIKSFDLSNAPPIHSRIKEIVHLKNAIHNMRIGLRSFQKYVPAELVRKLIETGENVALSGNKKRLVIFFSDITDFTSIAESMPPAKLMEHICHYFNELSTIIAHEKGTIDKYIGDSIMAFWGAPLTEKHPCHHAALAALQCMRRCDELNQQWEIEGKPSLVTRIGLHLGNAIVGNLGSSERLNYTAIGDNINVAKRLEGMNKMYGTRIMVSRPIYRIIQQDFALRMIDCVRAKGKLNSQSIYELLGTRDDILPFDLAAYQSTFARAFSAYQQQQWNIALLAFKECLVIYPADQVAHVFMQRCEHFKHYAPPSNWQGVWQMSEK